MKKFKEYLENIISKDNQVVFDYSTTNGINTALRNKPYSSKSSRLFGHTVLSLYLLTANETPLLRALKREDNKEINNEDMEYFIKRSVSYAYRYLPKDLDYIIYNKNSFPVLDKFIEQLALKFQSKTLNVSQSIYKTSTNKLYLKDNIPKKYKAAAENLLIKLKQKDTIKLRDEIPLRLRMFFGGFISIEDNVLNKLKNKNILIVDDVFTVGTTFSQLFQLIKQYNPNQLMGLTLFKY